MIKKMLMVKKNIDISSYHKLISFLKNNSVGHEAKKAMVLSKDDVIKFITEAPDEMHLMTKVALIFGTYGACRREELTNMSVNDIEDRGSVLVVTIPKTKTNKKRVFTIIDDDVVSALLVYRKYAALRPASVHHSRFFFCNIEINYVLCSLWEKTPLELFHRRLLNIFSYPIQRDTQDIPSEGHQRLCWLTVGQILPV